jgi:hypothetical protein
MAQLSLRRNHRVPVLSNEVRLGLTVLANNLGNLWRPLGLAEEVDLWALISPR